MKPAVVFIDLDCFKVLVPVTALVFCFFLNQSPLRLSPFLMYCWTRNYWGWPKAVLDGLGTGEPSNCGAGDVIPWKSRSALIEKWMDNKSPPGCLVICCWPKCVLGHPWGICSEVASSSALLHSSWKPPLLAAGSEEGAAEAKRDLLGAVGKLTDVVSCLGFSWWQGGPPHTQALKDLHWVRARARSLRWCGALFAQGLCFQIWPRPASPGDGGAALQHLRVLEGFLPLGERRLQLHLHLHHRCSGRTRFKVAPSQTPRVSLFPVYFCATGGAGEKLLMPGTGFLTIGAASSLAFCQVLREEYPEVPCKLNQVPASVGPLSPGAFIALEDETVFKHENRNEIPHMFYYV